MITSITIENFKGIRERIEIEFRPLTLLFGPNSAGKSTILHALHYAREVFERHNLDPDSTKLGGDWTDLGGFGKLVHGHDLRRVLTIGVEFDPAKIDDFLFQEHSLSEIATELGLVWHECDEADFLFSPYQPGYISIEFSISWNELANQPYVSAYVVKINGDFLARISADPASRRVALTEFQLDHTFLLRPSDWLNFNAATEEDLAPFYSDLDETILSNIMREAKDLLAYSGDDSLLLEKQPDAFPRGQDLTLALRTREEFQGLKEQNRFTSPARLVVRFTNNVVVRIDFWYKEVNPQKNPARKGSRYARSSSCSLYLPRRFCARGARHGSTTYGCGAGRSALSARVASS